MAQREQDNKPKTQQNEQQDQNQPDISYGMAGMDMDSAIQNVKKGFVTFAQNAVIENFDGKSYVYQNEIGNKPCIQFPSGSTLIGFKVIYELNKTFYFLAYEDGTGEIGYSYNNDCTYYSVFSASCLNFSVQYPIKGVEYEYVQSTLRLYFTDGNNPRRFIDFTELPYEKSFNGCTTVLNQDIDCNRMNVQPNFNIPFIQIQGVVPGGVLQEGTYQFAVQYCDADGNPLTSFYNVTNPVPIHSDAVSFQTDKPTANAISLTVLNLDYSFYSYFRLAVIKTVNNAPVIRNAGVYSINPKGVSILYTGEGEDQFPVLSSDDLFVRYDIYDTAQGVTSSNGFLIWYILKGKKRINYQSIANKIVLNWCTYKVPYEKIRKDGSVYANYKGYMRDEVYAFEIVFYLKGGKQTDRFHIPGRAALPGDKDIVANPLLLNYQPTPTPSQLMGVLPLDLISRITGTIPVLGNAVFGTEPPTTYHPPLEFVGEDNVLSPDSHSLPRWMVKDTSVVDQTFDVSEGLYQIGKMQYWESKETYPCDPDIWGDLAGTPIRHHKFPSGRKVPIHDNQGNIYLMGVYIDPQQIWKAIQDSDLTDNEKADIVGFKIVRANRAAHKSIIAKGLLYNVGKYFDPPQTDASSQASQASSAYYYPNYPFNDLSADPFLSVKQTDTYQGNPQSLWLNGFNSRDSYTNFTFHSPDTHFYQPYLYPGTLLKVESVEYGDVVGQKVEVKDHARLKYITPEAVIFVVGSYINLLNILRDKAEISDLFIGIKSLVDLIIETSPLLNYAKQFNAVGDYKYTFPVPETPPQINGFDNLDDFLFYIEEIKYLTSGFTTVNQGVNFNNNFRESSVYLKTTKTLYPSTVFSTQDGKNKDNSRSMFFPSCGIDFYQGNCSSYYASIKQYLPSQYGKLYEYESVDTGYYFDFTSQSCTSSNPNLVFGGDVFINKFALKRKLAYFNNWLVGAVDDIGIDYRNYRNIAYPSFWLSNTATGYSKDDLGNVAKASLISGGVDFAINELQAGLQGAITGAIVGGPIGAAAGFLAGIIKGLFSSAVDAAKVAALSALVYELTKAEQIKDLNVFCTSGTAFYQKGEFYLFFYGIPYFYCESEVNVDYRQAYNDKEGEYYPHVGTGIPNEWLQEKNVSIVNDNTYYYNQTYSKQNKETYFTYFPESGGKAEEINYDYRAIYSLQQADRIDYKEKRWLIYPPLNYYDFEQTKGKLISIQEINDNTLIVLFEKGSQLFNSAPRVDTNSGSFYLSSFNLFRATPRVNLLDSDVGYAGSQNRLFIKAGLSSIFVDAERGDIFMIPFNKTYYTRIFPISISKGISKFLKENLPFKIKKYFPDIDTDNNYMGIGLVGTYDYFYNRVLITKLDYEPKVQGITYQNGKFFYNGTEISLKDSNYFCNKSFTLSYNLLTKSWISFHSYTPNYYIPYPNFFVSGNGNDTWIHDGSEGEILFNTYYNEIQPYIVEFPFSYGGVYDKIVQSIIDYSEGFIYDEDKNEIKDQKGFFNKVILYNDKQCSGLLYLDYVDVSDPRWSFKYPQLQQDGKRIPLFKGSDNFKYNMFWDVVKDQSSPIFVKTCDSVLKELNQNNMDYSGKYFNKVPLKGRYLRVRNILDNRNDLKIITLFILNKDESYIK